jgi:hypothetical protein
MSARIVRKIRRCCQRIDRCRNHLGLSALWLAPPAYQKTILATKDTRLKLWLLGFTELEPEVRARYEAAGLAWCS